VDPYLARAIEAIEETAGRLDGAALRRKADGRWSACDILEHLTLAFRANAAAFEKALSSGTLKARPPRLAQRLAKILVVDAGYFPRREAPDITRPCGSVTPERSVSEARDALVALDGVMTRLVDRFGGDALVANHPFFAGLTVREWTKFHWRHTVHHMRQVRQRSSGRWRVSA
jgi:Protein of unknown function (DUF1569)